MALMVPDTIRSGTASTGERILFRRFRRELPDSCVVLHSLGLANHEHKIWGECDFVILSTQGIFVIEVKGGGVSCRNGRWVYTRSDGAENAKEEGPFEQAKTAMFAVKEAVEAEPKLRKLLYGYGVIMPNENFSTAGPEIELAVLLKASDFTVNLGDYIFNLSRFWHDVYLQKHGKAPRYPLKAEIDTIRCLLRPEIRTALTLDSFLTNLDQQMVELTEDQVRVTRCLDNNRRTTVAGRAGTGKTILAIDKAVRLAEQGKKVLYLCFNRLLGIHVNESVGKSHSHLAGRLHTFSIHSWFGSILESAGVKPPSDADSLDRFVDDYVNAYFVALERLDPEPYDALIIDEGQDLMRLPFFEAFDFALKGGLSQGHWHIFYDPLQNIYNGEIEPVIDMLESFGFARFSLTVNCRNTAEVATMTSIISGIDVPLERAVEGGSAKPLFYSNPAEMQKKLEDTVHDLIKKGVSRKDIIVLSRFRRENSCVAECEKVAGLWVNDLTSPVSRKETIDFCTIYSFKGLERKVVIAVDLQDLLDEEAKYLHYCGLTRARSTLVAFLKERDRDDFNRLSFEYGARVQVQFGSNIV